MKIRSPIIVTVGHIDHGKCLHGDEKVVLGTGEIKKISSLFEGKIKKSGEYLYVERRIPIFTSNGMEIKKSEATRVWKVESPGYLYEIKLKNGKKIRVTPEHPFLTIKGWKKCEELDEEDRIAVPLILPVNPSLKEWKKMLMGMLLQPDCLFKLKPKLLKRIGELENMPSWRIERNLFRKEHLAEISLKLKISPEKLLDYVEKIKFTSRKQRCSHRERWVPLQKNWGDFFYFLGFMFGDGTGGFRRVTNNNTFLLKKLNSILNDFGCKLRIFQGRTAKEANISGGLTLYSLGTEVFEFPKKKKSHNLKVPKLVMCAPNKYLAKFIMGVFDSDGYVDTNSCCIELTSVSPGFLEDLSILLLRLGITSTVYSKKKCTILRISGKDNIRRFKRMIGSSDLNKRKKVKLLLAKSRRQDIINKNVKIPAEILREIKALFLLSDRDLRNFSFWKNIARGTTIERWNRFVEYVKNITRKKEWKEKRAKYIQAIARERINGNIKKFLEVHGIYKNRKLTEFGKEAIKFWKRKDLETVLESLKIKDLGFVRIKSKKKIKFNGFVYDLSVPPTQNFIANGIIVHNTTLLDRIRGTTVAKAEPGEITQHVGASYVPAELIKKICANLIEKLNIKLTVPGLLFVDTPGHAAFINLRKRGGAVSDLAILVIDINEGFKEQTDESLKILREYKTPFVVAATKIDKITGWCAVENACFLDSFNQQSDFVKEETEKLVYRLASQLSERGFDSERFDRVEDFTKQVAIIPCSGKTGEGVPELLAILCGLAQQFLKDRLKVSETGRGTILEVKEVRGFGLTMDVILYDGTVRKGDYLIVGGKEPIVTKVKALLIPRPLQELRVEKQFEHIEEINAAAGIKIAAPNLEQAIPGSPIIFVRSEKDVERAKALVQAEVEEVEFSKEINGVVAKADTLGSLEALIKLLSEENIPIRKAEVGNVRKEDVIEASNVSDSLRKVVLAFNVKVLEDAEILAKDLKVEVFRNNIIYRLLEDYKEWCYQRKEREIQEKLERVTRPVKIKLLKGFVFRASKPCIVGVEILAGVLKPKTTLKREDGKIVGKVKEIQKEGQTIKEAKKGERVAISMEEPTVGRTVHEEDILTSVLTENDMKILREVWDRLGEDEKELLKNY